MAKPASSSRAPRYRPNGPCRAADVSLCTNTTTGQPVSGGEPSGTVRSSSSGRYPVSCATTASRYRRQPAPGSGSGGAIRGSSTWVTPRLSFVHHATAKPYHEAGQARHPGRRTTARAFTAPGRASSAAPCGNDSPQLPVSGCGVVGSRSPVDAVPPRQCAGCPVELRVVRGVGMGPRAAASTVGCGLIDRAIAFGALRHGECVDCVRSSGARCWHETTLRRPGICARVDRSRDHLGTPHARDSAPGARSSLRMPCSAELRLRPQPPHLGAGPSIARAPRPRSPPRRQGRNRPTRLSQASPRRHSVRPAPNARRRPGSECEKDRAHDHRAEEHHRERQVDGHSAGPYRA